FYCYRYPRVLHSFPTRRSSDLGSCEMSDISLSRRGTTRAEHGREFWRRVLLAGGVTAIPRWTAEPALRPEHGRRARGVGEHEARSEEHTSELQSRFDLVCRLLL